MKIVVQRVKHAQVNIDNNTVGKINKGLLLFIGIGINDNESIADKLVKKVCNLRIFEDENQKMNKSIKDIDGELLVVSQFTLYADCKNGNRPSFTNACEPKKANKIYDYFKSKCMEEVKIVESGVFGADMKIELLNDGPVTIILEEEQN
ncbi:MAG: D-tyrosyl-tRNA(Tyr) deacylase [Clostridia bacterium]|nr:D-tyrosyl-tRNA(Tyr) deacylase [Clostridia bacterium]